ncbi:hypothetical protein [Shewanella goraebulensis]|uniref:hypothetical protein n=1 Tax=Shewanella goraebulensis TaxID=3050637 RepID=UPI00254B984E|nr:hypothetical protein [Shewanella goraebulensis]
MQKNSFFTVICLATLFFSYKASACSCDNYYPASEQPEWVSKQQADDIQFISAGSSICTGLKSLDERRSDNDARISLSKLLNTRVKAAESSKIGAVDGASYARYSAKTSLDSEQVLKSAIIFERWADTKNCVVYAGIKVTQANIDSAITEKMQQKQQQLNAKNACVFSQGENKRQVKEWMIERLLQQGFVFEPNKNCQVNYHLSNKIISSQSDMVKNSLVVKIYTEYKPIWHKTYTGKALSFSHRSQGELTKMAISDSLDNFFVDLTELKSKPVTP